MPSQTRWSTPWGDATPPALPPLDRDATADVVVVGAGIAGLSVAEAASREGLRVVVLEAADVGSGDTGLTTAHLSSALDEGFTELERLHGGDGARLAYESHQAAIEEVERIAAEEGIDCDLRRVDGYLFLAPGDDPELLDRELAAARRAGFRDAEALPEIPGVPFDSGPCLRFPRQGRFHPLRYLHGLVRAVVRRGGSVHPATPVAGVLGRDGEVRTRDGHRVSAGAIVVATNAPVNDRVVVHSLESPWRTYAVALAVDGRRVADALYWDTGDPYHYVRLLGRGGGSELLVVGGEDHRAGEDGDAEARFARLAEWARRRFAAGDVVHRWSGQVLEPVDGLAFIGRDPLGARGVFVVSGDSGHGMTHGVLAGRVVVDLVLDRANPWARLYDPGRLPLAAAGELVEAGAHVARSYAEWLLGTPDEVRSADAIQAGHGGVLRGFGGPLAAYRDDAGVLHLRSAVCPHLGCLVHWNDGEKTWDCPCHGSRFTATGDVFHGPALRGLASVDPVPNGSPS